MPTAVAYDNNSHWCYVDEFCLPFPYLWLNRMRWGGDRFGNW